MKHLNLWLGSAESCEVFLTANARMLAREDMGSPSQFPSLLTVQDGVGILNITGSLVNGNAGWMSYFGVTGYADIRDALAEALSNPAVGSILLNIDSGGGAVAGVHETAQLISRVSKFKSVVSYTGGMEASAALWLGSSASQAYVAETAIVGSIGVLMVHAERSKQLAEDGYKVTVIRAGTQKALANPYEPLTDFAKTSLEHQAATIHRIFLGHVAEQRKLSVSAADKKFGQGQEFVGAEAVTAGLADKVGTLEDAFSAAKALADKLLKKSGRPNTAGFKSDNLTGVLASAGLESAALADNATTSEGTTMPKPLTQEQLAAMAAGVSLEDVDAAATDAQASQQSDGATAEATAAQLSALTAQVEELTAAAATSATALAEAQSALADSQAAVKASTDAQASLQVTADALGEIVRNSMRLMAVGLGADTSKIATLALPELVAEHSSMAASFKSKFKVGAVAATNTSEEQPKPAMAAVNPLFAFAAKSLK